MAAINGLLLQEPGGANQVRYDVAPDGESGEQFRVKTVPWEVSRGMPATPWKVELLPFDAGAARTKDLNPRGLSLQLQAPADTFLPEMVVPGPLVNPLTLTSATAQATKMVQATDSTGTAVFAACGRWLVRISSTYSITTQDLGASNVITDIVQINGDLIICLGHNTNVARRSAAGVISNGNFAAWSMAIVRDRIWRVGYPTGVGANTTVNNTLSWMAGLNAADASAVIVNANWTTANPAYIVGDRTYQCVQLYDVGGTLAGGRSDGLYMPDPATKFQNITPQVFRTPDPSGLTGYGGYNAFGNFYFPYQRGLLEVRPGAAGDVGPGTAYLPLVGLRVMSGLEWDRMMYILCQDVRTGATLLLKMVPDRRDIADGEFVFQPYAYLATTTNYGRAMAMFSAPTNPTLVFGGGAGVTDANYIILGRGAGRDIDDSGYRFANGSTFVTTGMFSPDIDSSMVATLVSTQVKVGNTAGASTPIKVYYNASNSMMPGDGATNLMATVAGGVVGDITTSGVSIRYAGVGTQGTFFNLKAEFTSVGTNAIQPTILRWTAHGYYNPKVTDELTFRLELQESWLTIGPRDTTNLSAEQQVNVLRAWCNTGKMLEAQIEGYGDNIRDNGPNLIHVLVQEVGEVKNVTMPSSGNSTQMHSIPVCDLTVVRIDLANEYPDT